MAAVAISEQITGLRHRLMAFTRRFTTDREESSDLVQDTLLKALMHQNKYRQDTNLQGWLFTIMRNTFINNYRRNQHVRTLHGRTNDLYLTNIEDNDTLNLPEARCSYKDIWQHVNTLREELLVPLKMHISGYKYHEIAEHLHLPMGTVKSRIFHARKEIQKKLA